MWFPFTSVAFLFSPAISLSVNLVLLIAFMNTSCDFHFLLLLFCLPLFFFLCVSVGPFLHMWLLCLRLVFLHLWFLVFLFCLKCLLFSVVCVFTTMVAAVVSVFTSCVSLFTSSSFLCLVLWFDIFLCLLLCCFSVCTVECGSPVERVVFQLSFVKLNLQRVLELNHICLWWEIKDEVQNYQLCLCVCMCVCIWVCVCLCVYVCVCVRAHVCVWTRPNTVIYQTAPRKQRAIFWTPKPHLPYQHSYKLLSCPSCGTVTCGVHDG